MLSAIQAIKLVETNLSLISENAEMITPHTFDIDSLNKRIVDLENHLKIFQDDLDDTRNEAWGRASFFETLSKNHRENLGAPLKESWQMKYIELFLIDPRKNTI